MQQASVIPSNIMYQNQVVIYNFIHMNLFSSENDVGWYWHACKIPWCVKGITNEAQKKKLFVAMIQG